MVNVNIDFKWEPVLESETTKYLFPHHVSSYMKKNYNFPAIYRWAIYQNNKLESVYIGETEILCPRRIYHYLKPGPSQMTNLRINSMFKQLVKEGKSIGIEKLSFKDFMLDGKSISVTDLNRKNVRVFLENLLLIYHENEGVQLLNKAIK